MNKKTLKYLIALTPLCVWFYLGCATSRPAVSEQDRQDARQMEAVADRVARETEQQTSDKDTTGITAAAPLVDSIGQTEETIIVDSLAISVRDSMQSVIDSIAGNEARLRLLANLLQQHINRLEQSGGRQNDSIAAVAAEFLAPMLDSMAMGLELPPIDETMLADLDMMRSLAGILAVKQQELRQVREEAMEVDSMLMAALDTLPKVRPPVRPFLDDPIFATAADSMTYTPGNNMIQLYRDANVDYQDLNVKSDKFSADMLTKMISGEGMDTDSGVRTRPVFTRGGQPMDMEILTYNLGDRQGLVSNLSMQEGEGFMRADLAKIHSDNQAHMSGGMYTTCNHIDHPHFYIRMYRGKLIPNNKVIFGLTHFVLEDVPLYFPFIPFGFFPLATGPSSGFIMPSFGEDNEKGFFIRDGGYYFRLGDYADGTVTASIYTLGSWDTRASTRYLKRYKYNGSLNFGYSQNILGEKGSTDYINSGTYTLTWNHTQDPKFRPNSTFSASVNYASSGSKRYGSTTVEDYIQTQISSSIAYSKTIPATEKFPGGSFTMAFRHSQNARDSTISFTFPDASWNIQKFNPLKHKHLGKERWYEKISMSYSGSMRGSLDNIKERDLFTSGTLDQLRSGIEHKIPVSLSFTMLGYINTTASGNYTERWLFRRENRYWDEVNKVVAGDTTSGFYRVYEYNASASLSTKVFGMYQMKNPNGFLRAVRHVITPSVSISVKPDFSDPKFGFHKTYQSSADGTTTTYSPYNNVNYYGAPAGGESATMSFSLQQNLEAKIRSDRDTTGERKIAIIENLSLSSGYNLLADSMNLSAIGFNLSIPIVSNYKLSLSGTLDPYQYDPVARTRYNRFTFADGKLPRLTAMSTSFSWSWAPTFGSATTIEQFERSVAMHPLATDPESPMTPAELRSMLAAAYYDFSIPFNFNISYSLSYSNAQRQRELKHTINFGASLTLTPFKADGQSRWAVSVSTFGYDLNNKALTPGNLSVTRDLHCFVMTFNWSPVGLRQWSFNIRIKSDILKDIKYDKNRNYYESLYD